VLLILGAILGAKAGTVLITDIENPQGQAYHSSKRETLQGKLQQCMEARIYGLLVKKTVTQTYMSPGEEPLTGGGKTLDGNVGKAICTKFGTGRRFPVPWKTHLEKGRLGWEKHADRHKSVLEREGHLQPVLGTLTEESVRKGGTVGVI